MKLLIANRGEIAARIIRTAKKLQVPTLILYTKTDETTLPVFTADESVLVESYLDQCVDCKVFDSKTDWFWTEKQSSQSQWLTRLH